MRSIKNPPSPSITYSSRFVKQFTNTPDTVKAAFWDTVVIFIENPHHPILRDHALRGKYAGYRSIDVAFDWRAVFKVTHTAKGDVVTFHLIGTHKMLYG